MRSLSDDMKSLCLVKECRELELYYGTNPTDIVLTDADTSSRCAIRKNLRVIDRDKLVEKCSMKSPSIACIIRKGGSWPKLWYSALHLGSRHTIGLQQFAVHSIDRDTQLGVDMDAERPSYQKRSRLQRPVGAW